MRGSAHPWSISLLVDLFSAAVLSTDWEDLWFPLSIIALRSDFFCFLFDWIEVVTRPVLDYTDNLSFTLVMEKKNPRPLCGGIPIHG